MTKKEKTLVNGVSRSAWIRRQFVKKPDITLEAMQTAYAKTKYPQNQPITKQHWYQGRSQLMQRYDFENQGLAWEDFPIAGPTGKANVSAFIRFYLATFTDPSVITEADCVKFMEVDGFGFNGGVFRNVRSKLKNGAASVEAEAAEPDADQADGSRAGKPGKRKYVRRKKGGRRKKDDPTVVDQYEKIEAQLDGLMAKAEDLKDGKLSSALKQARRRAGAFIVSHQ
jgi:hypothetical protein